MRSATAIVGAIAISSCLIALALVLTSGNRGTHTVTMAAAPQPARVADKPTTGKPSASGTPTGSPVAGPVQCSVEVTVEGVSCYLGKAVLAAFESGGSKPGTLTATDPQSGESVNFECAGAAPTECLDPGGEGRVYLAPSG